jgi:hypothetical protein
VDSKGVEPQDQPAPHTQPSPSSSQQTFVAGTLQDMVITANHYQNVGSPMVTITRDKLKLRAVRHLPRMMRRAGWFAPLGSLLTSAAVLANGPFTKGIILTPDQWTVFFDIVFLGSACWLVFAIIAAVWFSSSTNNFVDSCFKDED